MKKEDLNEMYVIAKGLNNKRNNRELFAQKNFEEIKRLLNVIKEEYPDGFWYYSKNFNQTVLFFLNMVTPYCRDLVEKSFKSKGPYDLLSAKPLCSIEQIKKVLTEYRRDNHIIELGTENQVLYVIEHQAPIQYFSWDCKELIRYLTRESFVEVYKCGGTFANEERVIYYIK